MAHGGVVEQQLGFDVGKAEVRLVPGTTDPYAWQYGPEQRHLFQKQLSKHNIGAYRQICHELGRSIRVVARDDQSLSVPTSDNVTDVERPALDGTCSARLQSLRNCDHLAREAGPVEVGNVLSVTAKLIHDSTLPTTHLP